LPKTSLPLILTTSVGVDATTKRACDNCKFIPEGVLLGKGVTEIGVEAGEHTGGIGVEAGEYTGGIGVEAGEDAGGS
jgi:hypothetical protein